jgi:hypothetical protein
VDSISGFHELKSQNICIRTREITKREVPRVKGLCGPLKAAGKTGGTLSTRESISLTISGFRGVKSSKPLHQNS